MAKPRGVDAPRAPRSTFPDWIEPMAATLTQERFTGADWLFERKFDGIRLVAFKQGSDVRLYSRTRHVQHLPDVAAAIAALPVDEIVLDGEMTWDGHPAYHVFDIVWLDGRDVTRLTLTERRAVHDFVIGGFTDPQGARVGLGALLVGYYEGDDFVFAGKVGTGFDTKLLTELRVKLDRTEVDATPFTKAKGLPRLGAHWVRPTLVVQVAFIEWTVHTKLRHPRLLGLCPERKARHVVRQAQGSE
jgi:ATP-dependent DNA ligase